MARVSFLTNLGLHAANHFGLDGTKCTYESEVEVSEETADILVKAGIVSVIHATKTIKAIPEAPAIAGIAPVTRDAETESTIATKSKKKS